MKHSLIILLTIACLLTVSLIAPLGDGAEAGSSLTFPEVYDALNRKNQTRLFIKEYLRNHRGDEVSWRGKVVDVAGGRGKARVMIANKKRPTTKGYNIVLTVYGDVDIAAGFKKGQRVAFTGYLHKAKATRNGRVIVYVDDATFK